VGARNGNLGPSRKPQKFLSQAFNFFNPARKSLDEYVLYLELPEICMAQAFNFWKGPEKTKKRRAQEEICNLPGG
jgi:hypothetical protein